MRKIYDGKGSCHFRSALTFTITESLSLIFNIDEPWNVFRSIVLNFLRNLKYYVMLIFRTIELNSWRIFYGLMEKNEATIRRISFVALTYIRNYVRKRFSPIKITLNSIKKMLLQISKKNEKYNWIANYRHLILRHQFCVSKNFSHYKKIIAKWLLCTCKNVCVCKG